MKRPTRSFIVQQARSWVGVPYRHQGRNRLGVDCSGPLVAIAKDIGIEGVTDVLTYSRHPVTFALKQQMDKVLIPIDPREIQPGDVCLFKMVQIPQHVAIVGDYKYGGLSLIHCYQKVGRMVEHRFAGVWWGRLAQAYRLPDIVEDM